MNSRPPEYSAIQRMYGRAASFDEDNLSRLLNEYDEIGPAAWGKFTMPLTDGHGALWVRSLILSSAGVPVVPGGGALNVDDIAVTEIGSNARSFLYGFDGVGWDRIRSGTNSADGVATFGTGVLEASAYPFGFNGTTFDRLKTQSITNDQATVGILQTVKPSQWSATDTPAANIAPVATRAAAGAGIANICNTIHLSIVGPAASVGGLQVQLLDGAAVIWESVIFLDLGVGQVQVKMENLELIGTANTAMILQLNAIPGDPALFASAAMSGHVTV